MTSGTGPMSELNALYLRPLRQHWRLWMLPTVLFTAAAVAFALFGPKQWLASQQLVVRNESLGTQIGLGRFESNDVMKTVEETIHAVAKNRHVAAAVLNDVGPPANNKTPQQWPSAEEIDDFLEDVSVTAPNGAIFGQTEVIHVNVKADAPDRAMALTADLCEKLEQQLIELRAERSAGMQRELEEAVALAEQELDQATQQLAKLEQTVGADLSELRTMDQQVAGGTGSLTLELGRARENLQESKRQAAAIDLRRDHLRKIKADPHAIVSVPATVLSSHATLAQLKTGLVEAELELAKELSKYDTSHPRVRRIQEEVEQVQQRLKQEVEIALTEADFDAQSMQQRIDDLEQVTEKLKNRIERIALIRVDYNRLQAKVEQKKSDFATASSQLAEVEANQRAAQASSIINRIGEPVVSTHPIGPSKKVVVAGGAIAGFAVGIGLVFLLIPSDGRAVQPHSFVAHQAAVTSMDQDAAIITERNLSGAPAVTGQAATELNNDVAASSTTCLPTLDEEWADLSGEQMDPSIQEPHLRPIRPTRATQTSGSGTPEAAVVSQNGDVDRSTTSVSTEAPVRPRRAAEVKPKGDSEDELIYQLHQLREEMLRGKRPTS